MIKYIIQEIIFPIFFSPGDTHTKGMLFLLHLGLQGVTEVDTDPKERFASFKVTTSNERSLFVPLQSIASQSSWLGGAFLKYYKKICKIKDGNENKIMLGVLNCTMDKIDRVIENKTERLYRCCSSYALSKLIVDNGLEDLLRRENSDSPEFICYDRSFARDQYRPSILIFGKGPMEADEPGGIWVVPSP